MRYTKFKEESLSLLGMGTMRLPQKGTGWGMPIVHDRAQEVIDYCIAQGINFFDTAYIYHGGESEVFLGKALSKYPRDSFYVADKYNISAQPDYRLQFEEQMNRLQMDHMEFYLIHAIADDNISDYLSNGCIEYFLEQKKNGKIKYLGFSFHGTPEALSRTTSYCSWDFAMIQLNYFDWFHGIAKELYNHLVEKGIPIMAMEPVHGGLLASLTNEGNAMLHKAQPDKTIASWAIRFLMGLPGVAVIVSGMSDIEQLKDNIATVNERKLLTPNDEELLLKASTLLFNTVAALCTSCRYCLNDCPQELEIHSLLNTYNEYKADPGGHGQWRLNRLKGLPEEKRPQACTSCGICVKHCPQNLDIPALMRDIANTMKEMENQ